MYKNYKQSMDCKKFKSDGVTTIGYIDGEPALWAGNGQPAEGEPFAPCPSGRIWHEFQVIDSIWEEIPIIDNLPF